MAKATRQAFGEKLAELGATHSEIVVLDADLAKSTKSEIFAKKFPERFYEMGIQEANMIGVAAGLSFTGKVPFLCSFGCFLTGRYDTIRLSVAYAQANVRLVGTHAGVGIGDDGHSQMGLEDVALMRALPTMGVFQPMDARDTDVIMEYLVKDWKGPAYLRLTRQSLPDFYPKDKKFSPLDVFQIKTPVLAKPREMTVALIGTGAGVAEAMIAAEKLTEKGVAASVWNASCLKPFDDKTVREIAAKVGMIVTVEDHSVIGGLGSCVSDAVSSMSSHARVVKIGVQDLFGESGEGPELFDLHGISGAKIAETVARELDRP